MHILFYQAKSQWQARWAAWHCPTSLGRQQLRGRSLTHMPVIDFWPGKILKNRIKRRIFCFTRPKINDRQGVKMSSLVSSFRPATVVRQFTYPHAMNSWPGKIFWKNIVWETVIKSLLVCCFFSCCLELTLIRLDKIFTNFLMAVETRLVSLTESIWPKIG